MGLWEGSFAICACPTITRQAQRIPARGGALWGPSTGHHYGVPNAHDNTFLLLEQLLAVPYMLGFQVCDACRASVSHASIRVPAGAQSFVIASCVSHVVR